VQERRETFYSSFPTAKIYKKQESDKKLERQKLSKIVVVHRYYQLLGRDGHFRIVWYSRYIIYKIINLRQELVNLT